MPVKTPLQLYKYLLRCVEKLPKEAQSYYRHHIRQAYVSHSDESDEERIKQIVDRAVEDAEWVLKKIVFHHDFPPASEIFVPLKNMRKNRHEIAELEARKESLIPTEAKTGG